MGSYLWYVNMARGRGFEPLGVLPIFQCVIDLNSLLSLVVATPLAFTRNSRQTTCHYYKDFHQIASINLIL